MCCLPSGRTTRRCGTVVFISPAIEGVAFKTPVGSWSTWCRLTLGRDPRYLLLSTSIFCNTTDCCCCCPTGLPLLYRTNWWTGVVCTERSLFSQRERGLWMPPFRNTNLFDSMLVSLAKNPNKQTNKYENYDAKNRGDLFQRTRESEGRLKRAERTGGKNIFKISSRFTSSSATFPRWQTTLRFCLPACCLLLVPPPYIYF